MRCAARRATPRSTKLSGGEKRRVALTKLLLAKPDILLLDEPTNHLDAESVAWLERYLKDYAGCIMLVTHDRYFLDNITEWTLELDRGQGVPYKGNYSSWLEQKAKRLEVEKGQEEAKQRTLRRELEWIRASPKARQAKSKARIQAYDKLAEEAGREEVGKAQIQIPPGPRLGGVVVEVEGLSKAFGDKLLIDDLSFKLPPGGIVGVIGPNGAGKTTLFKMITGQEKPDGGAIRLGRHRQARLRRPEPRPPQRQEDRLGGDLRRPRHHEARRQDGDERPAPTSAGSTSRGPTSRRRSGCSRAASATACISPRC